MICLHGDDPENFRTFLEKDTGKGVRLSSTLEGSPKAERGERRDLLKRKRDRGILALGGKPEGEEES